MKRREAKNKGGKESYTHLNAEFQRIARRDKKAFLSEQCKEIEENNRMEKTRDHFMPPFPESPRCLSPFQGNLFSLHCLDFLAENGLTYFKFSHVVTGL